MATTASRRGQQRHRNNGEVRRVVEIVIVVVARRAVAIIAGNGKTPVHLLLRLQRIVLFKEPELTLEFEII
jgi:hypothetical protein